MGKDMTFGKGGRLFPGIGAAALLAAALFGTACSSTTVEDVPAAEGRSGGPVDTGTFPNLNIPPQAATAQFTENESQAKLAQLRALQQNQSRGASVESPEILRKRLQVSQDEQDETLKIIEGE